MSRDWRPGKAGAIVSDDHSEGGCDPVNEEYYGGHFICESVGGARADLICKAVNGYDDALAALTAVLEAIDSQPMPQGAGPNGSLARMVEAAIGKLSGEARR